MTQLRYLLVLILLAGCGSSPPTRFYTLEPTGTPSSGLVRTKGAVAVGQITLPAELDRLSFVTREDANRISVSDQDRWAAPLEGMVRRVLAADLARRLPAGAVIAPGDPVPPNAHTVTLTIRNFIGDASGHVVLDADWAVSQGKGRPAIIHRETIAREAGSGEAGAIAAAMSQALGVLSDRIAAALQVAA
ncbi:MAG: membrane integrity-associated transporter subunit PqiC [Alphaproteobacteria bacterium]|nr:membrane integrity-associated transporter subunit PqiC [Alphaproteobacteria bacterium]